MVISQVAFPEFQLDLNMTFILRSQMPEMKQLSLCLQSAVITPVILKKPYLVLIPSVEFR